MKQLRKHASATLAITAAAMNQVGNSVPLDTSQGSIDYGGGANIIGGSGTAGPDCR